jgi:hypothetical protein
MVCAVCSISEGRRDGGGRPAGMVARTACWSIAQKRDRAQGLFASFSGRDDRFATGATSLARTTKERPVSYGIRLGIASIVIIAMVNPGMLDSGAAVAGVLSPAKWGGSAGSGALLNRGGG